MRLNLKVLFSKDPVFNLDRNKALTEEKKKCFVKE